MRRAPAGLFCDDTEEGLLWPPLHPEARRFRRNLGRPCLFLRVAEIVRVVGDVILEGTLIGALSRTPKLCAVWPPSTSYK
jgi:hypothetical protein